MFVRRSFVAAGLIAALACVPLVGRGAPSADAPAELTIAYQPGLSYSSLIVMRERGSLEKPFPQTKITWLVLNSTAAVRDGFIANQIQIGAGSIPPFLTGWDRGVGWKILASLNQMSVWQRARARHRDDHPTGLQALSVGQLNAHLSGPPFQYEEVQRGGHVVLRSFDVFGPHTFNSVYVNEKFANEHPHFVQAFYHDLLDATQFLKQNPGGAADILAKDAGGNVSAHDFEGWLRRKDVIFSTTPHGFLAMAKFMQSIGNLTKTPRSMHDINYSGALGGAGD